MGANGVRVTPLNYKESLELAGNVMSSIDLGLIQGLTAPFTMPTTLSGLAAETGVGLGFIGASPYIGDAMQKGVNWALNNFGDKGGAAAAYGMAVGPVLLTLPNGLKLRKGTPVGGKRTFEGTVEIKGNTFYKIKDPDAPKGYILKTLDLIMKSADDWKNSIKDTKRVAEANKVPTAFVDSHGVEWNPSVWFGQRVGAMKATKDDIRTFMNHAKDEYVPLTLKLIDEGVLYKEGNNWFGTINGNPIKLDGNQGSLQEFIVAHSEAFKKANLGYDGQHFVSGVPARVFHDLNETGGVGHAQWMSDNAGAKLGGNPVTQTYLEKNGMNIQYVTDKNAPVTTVHGTGTSNSYKDGIPVANYITPDGITIFDGMGKGYLDNGSGGWGTSRVIGDKLRVKALRGNNGDFDMTNPNVFSYNNNINNNDRYYV